MMLRSPVLAVAAIVLSLAGCAGGSGELTGVNFTEERRVEGPGLVLGGPVDSSMFSSAVALGGWEYLGWEYYCGPPPESTFAVNDAGEWVVSSQEDECWWIDRYRYTAPGGSSTPPSFEAWSESGGGGGGAGGDSGSPPTGTDVSTAEAVEDLFTDQGSEIDSLPIDPECTPENQERHAPVKAFCKGRVPTSSEIQVLRDAIDRIRYRGAYCSSIAEMLDDIVDRAAIDVRVYEKGSYTFDGAAPLGGGPVGGGPAAGWLAISSRMLQTYNSPSSRLRGYDPEGRRFISFNIDDVLVHEAEHLDGWSHEEGSAELSPHMFVCGSAGVN